MSTSRDVMGFIPTHIVIVVPGWLTALVLGSAVGSALGLVLRRFKRRVSQ